MRQFLFISINSKNEYILRIVPADNMAQVINSEVNKSEYVIEITELTMRC